MEEERLMILQMVEEGKITAEEAGELLAALEGHARAEREAPQEEIRRVERQVGSLQEQVEKTTGGIERAANDLADRIEKEVSSKIEGLPEFVEKLVEGINIPGLMNFFGPTHEFKEELTGEFAAEAGSVVELDFLTKNGRVEVVGWNEPGYKVVLTKKVQASSKAEAEEIANRMVEYEQAGDHLMVHWTNGENVRGGLKIEAYVPTDYVYRPSLTSSNGRVVVQDLSLEDAELTTSNGRIECIGVQARDVKARTSNGRVVLEGVSGSVRARTSNGRIVLATEGIEEDAEFDLSTSNGSITVKAEETADIGFDVEARTNLGRISVSVPNLAYEVDNRERRGHKNIKAHTVDFESKPVKVRVTAGTSNGSVKIGTVED